MYHSIIIIVINEGKYLERKLVVTDVMYYITNIISVVNENLLAL